MKPFPFIALALLLAAPCHAGPAPGAFPRPHFVPRNPPPPIHLPTESPLVIITPSSQQPPQGVTLKTTREYRHGKQPLFGVGHISPEFYKPGLLLEATAPPRLPFISPSRSLLLPMWKSPPRSIYVVSPYQYSRLHRGGDSLGMIHNAIDYMTRSVWPPSEPF